MTKIATGQLLIIWARNFAFGIVEENIESWSLLIAASNHKSSRMTSSQVYRGIIYLSQRQRFIHYLSGYSTAQSAAEISTSDSKNQTSV